MKLVNRRIKEEEERCLNYLIDQTKNPLIQTLIEVMVERYSLTLISMEGSGLESMIAHEQFSNIKIMYELFSRAKEAIS